MDLSIKLQAYDFSDRTPTKTQMENMFGEIADFLQRCTGSVLATGEFNVKEPFLQHVFNAAGALLTAKDALGSNASGLAIPRSPQGPQR